VAEIRLIEIEPGRFVVDKPRLPPARSALPCPNIISDEMPPCEQVDGKVYTSKSSFRRVGRAHGMVELGTEKQKPKIRMTEQRSFKEARRASIKKVVEKYKAGHRPRRLE
jgi:hypothetical protein